MQDAFPQNALASTLAPSVASPERPGRARRLPGPGPGLGRWLEGAAEAVRRELRLSRARRTGSLRLGSLSTDGTLRADPYADSERAAAHHLLLEALAFRGGEVASDAGLGLVLTVTTASSAVRRDAALLARLDQEHAVQVRLCLSLSVTESATEEDGEGEGRGAKQEEERGSETAFPGIDGPLLAAAARLAAEGLDVRLCLLDAKWASEADLRPLLAAARDAGVSDVEAAFGDAASRQTAADFQALRLSYGFPRALPGRG